MRLPAHIHHPAQKWGERVIRMQRLDLGVLGLGEIVHIVALNRLVQKWQPQSQNEQANDDQFAAQKNNIAGPLLWRTHPCGPCRDSSRRKDAESGSQRSHECERGTHECVRHIRLRINLLLCSKWRWASSARSAFVLL